MSSADNKGVCIHYEVEGSGPPLVLQHWSLATLEDWRESGYASALRDAYQLILIDARGHGASDKPHDPGAYALEHRVSDIVAVLDDLGIARAHFLGYSMGGWIGFGVAKCAPDRFRSLIIGGQHPYAQSMDGLRQLIRRGVENGAQVFVEVLREAGFGPLSSAQEERILRYDLKALLAVAGDRGSLESVLPTMTMPCLLYVGEKDAVFPLARRAAERMPNVTFVTLPGLGHGGVIERVDLVVPHIRQFLAGVDR
jgi:pimeloyl-ACP methyl ester carboxylesterase